MFAFVFVKQARDHHLDLTLICEGLYSTGQPCPHAPFALAPAPTLLRTTDAAWRLRSAEPFWHFKWDCQLALARSI